MWWYKEAVLQLVSSLALARIPPEGARLPQHAKEAVSTLTSCERFAFSLDLGIQDTREALGLCPTQAQMQEEGQESRSQGPDEQDLCRLHENTDKPEFYEVEEQPLKDQGYRKAEFGAIFVGVAIFQV